MAGEPPAHELAQRLEIALVAEVLPGVAVLAASAVFLLSSPSLPSSSMTRLKPVPTGSTNTRSVNASHDSSFGDEPGRHLRQRPVGRKRDPQRPDGAHVQIRRRRARAAVEDEGHRTVAIPVRDVGDREDLRRRLLLLAQDDPLARSRCSRSTGRPPSTWRSSPPRPAARDPPSRPPSRPSCPRQPSPRRYS